jgi:putative hydrolase of HD superfamily
MKKTKDEITNLVEFFRTIGNLKKIKRAGWLRVSIPFEKAESISDHVFRTTLMAYILSEGEMLDRNKLIKMALIHDICESVCGDITPHDGILKEKKFELEKNALFELISGLESAPHLRKELFDLWLEYENGNTIESKFVKQIDILERIMQAKEYLDEGIGDKEELMQFYEDARFIVFPKLKSIFEKLKLN